MHALETSFSTNVFDLILSLHYFKKECIFQIGKRSKICNCFLQKHMS